MSKLAQDIILRPIITEESMLGTADKKYTFSVAKDANKITPPTISGSQPLACPTIQ